MHRRLLLLGLLRQQEMHGYQLNEFIDRMLHVCSDLKKPTAYFLLEKLAQEGYVAETTEREGRYPERKVYSITPAGHAYFLTLLRENLASFDRIYYPGDMGLAFMHELPPEERVQLLRQRQSRVAAALSEIQTVPSHGGSLDFVLDRNAALLRSELAWLDDAISRAGSVAELNSQPVRVEPGR
jgi:DNA-binding PadR family transcriptional regulator